MSFRVSALVSVVGVLVLSSLTPAFAQPQPPVRPRYSAFQSVFRPGQPPLINPGPGILGQNQGFFNPAGPLAPGFVNPNGLVYPQNQPIIYATDPNLAPTGVVGTFNNLGHWYPGGYNYAAAGVGHWYPNGLANGRGVLGYGGGYAGGLYGGGGLMTGGGRGGPSLLGTANLGAATFNQFRR